MPAASTEWLDGCDAQAGMSAVGKADMPITHSNVRFWG